jgi:glucosylceramidase
LQLDLEAVPDNNRENTMAAAQRRWRQRLAATALAVMAAGAWGGVQAGGVQAWITTADRSLLLAPQREIAFSQLPAKAAAVEIDSATRYQEMIGFGAALTDASAWLIQQRMQPAQRAALLEELFGREHGIGLSFTRLTIGASDFSRQHYSFDDMPPGQSDPGLAHFSIEPNRADVLPVLKAARALNPQLRVMASPWSAPGWMKTSDSLVQGSLKPEAYGVFAEYLRRYLDAYQAEGIPMYALTLQNEPHFEPANYPGMRVDPAMRAAFIGGHLGPLLAATHPDTRILDWDHNWSQAWSPLKVLADPQARKYIAGVAWHCYEGDVAVQARVHDIFPDKEVYFTECSGGGWDKSWPHTLQYFTRELMIGAVQGWAKGVLLWNLALDEHDGPHLGGCGDCRGVVTIDSQTGAVSRNVEYYALAHMSRFVRPGAQRIKSGAMPAGVDAVAFRNADDGSLVLVLANGGRQARALAIRDKERAFRYKLPAGSVATLVWAASAAPAR